MSAAETQPPVRLPPRLISAPKVRQLYWCDFPRDAQMPEFWKTRPVVVVSYRNTLSGCVTVVPCSSKERVDSPWAVPLGSTIDGSPSWAVCDMVTSVAVSRLSPGKGRVIRLTEIEFDVILTTILKWLPRPLENRRAVD